MRVNSKSVQKLKILKLFCPNSAEYPDHVSVIEETITNIKYGRNSFFMSFNLLKAKKTGSRENITDINPMKN